MTGPIKSSSGSPRLEVAQALASSLFLDVKTLRHLAEQALPFLACQLCVAWCQMGLKVDMSPPPSPPFEA